MTEFPKAAMFGKRITLVQLRKQGLPARCGDSVKSLVWAYKLSPSTMNLAATDAVKEIEVMDLSLKERCSTLRQKSALIAAIDRLIPNPLIFRLHDEDGRPSGIAFNIKVSGGGLWGASDVFRLFHSAADVALPSGVMDLEAFLKAFAASVSGMATSPEETLRDFDARHYRLESLRADLADLEKKLARESQLDRKYALAKEKQRIEKEIKQCQNLNT